MAIKTLEQFIVEAQTEIDAQKTANGGNGLFMQFDGVKREYTDVEYEQAVNDLAKLKLKQQDNDYKIARQEAYGSIADQLDMQYWDLVNGTTTWKDHITQVKSDNPKPV